MKKFFSLILVLALAVSVFPAYAFAEADAEALSDKGGTLQTGSYILEDDVVLEEPLYIGEDQTVSIDLNGKVLTAFENSSAVTVLEGAVLNLYDSGETGMITGGKGTVCEDELSYGGGLFICTNATVNIYGGNITGNASDNGSAIYNLGWLNIYSCTMTENLSGYSGVVYNEGVAAFDGTVNISENITDMGAGAVLNQGELSLGGEITITENQAGGYSGGIVSLASEDCLVFTGGKYIIENNTIMDGKPADLLYSFWGTPLMFTVSGEIEEGSRIGLFGASDDFEDAIYIAVSASQNLEEFFFSDDDNYKTFTEEGCLAIKPAVELSLTLDEPIKEDGVTFDKALNKRILKGYLDNSTWDYVLPEGNYALIDDIVYEEYGEGYGTVIDGNVNINLNGHDIIMIQGSSSDLFDIGEGSSLGIYGEGTIKGFDSVARVEGGSFTLNGGTITENECFGCGIIYVMSGSFEMNGGYIGNNTYYNWSSAVWIDEDASFAMYGGKIADNDSDRDPCGVAVYGNITLGGDPVIYGNTYEYPQYVDRSHVASNLVLYKGATIEISKEKPLKAGAKIGVTIDDNDYDTKHDCGAVTGKYTGDLKSCFAADDPCVELKQTGSGNERQIVFEPYMEITVDSGSQYVKLGNNAEYEINAEPAGLGGYKVSYAEADAEELIFKTTRPDANKEGEYIVKIERDCDGTYAPVKEFGFLAVAPEVTISYDISSADAGTQPESQTGISGQFTHLAKIEDIEKAGYSFLGWEYEGELYENGWWCYYEEDTVVVPVWEIKIINQPTRANEYTVGLEIKPESVQWQSKEPVVRNLTENDIDMDEFEFSEDGTAIFNDQRYLNLDLKDDLIEDGVTLSFDCEEDLSTYSEKSGFLTRTGNHYVYTFNGTRNSIRIQAEEGWDGYWITNVKLSASGFLDIKGETGLTLKNPKHGKTYRCLVTDADGREILTDEVRVISFSDVCETDWFRNAVYFCGERNILKTDAEKLFAPSETVTRADVIDAISAIDGSEVWIFDEDEETDSLPITREAAVAMLYEYQSYYYEGFEGEWMFLLPYGDRSDISGDAFEAVAFMTMKGVIAGYENGNFCPQRNLTRAELAKMMMEYSRIEK